MIKPRRNVDISFIKSALEYTSQMSAEIVNKLFSEAKVSENIVCITDKPIIILSKEVETVYITVRKIPLKYVREYVNWKIKTFVSAIEDRNIAKLLKDLLKTDVPKASVPVELRPGDTMIIFKCLSDDIEYKSLNKSELKEGVDYEFLFVEIK